MSPEHNRAARIGYLTDTDPAMRTLSVPDFQRFQRSAKSPIVGDSP
jgi:hypothetical protein